MGWLNMGRGAYRCVSEGDMLRTQLAILRRLAKFTPANVIGVSGRSSALHSG